MGAWGGVSCPLSSPQINCMDRFLPPLPANGLQGPWESRQGKCGVGLSWKGGPIYYLPREPPT